MYKRYTGGLTDNELAATSSWTSTRTTKTCLWQLVVADSEYHIPGTYNHILTSGSAFKFLPVMPKYVGQAFNQKLPAHLANKWRFRTEYQYDKEAFLGDGSRGGPERREFDMSEKARL